MDVIIIEFLMPVLSLSNMRGYALKPTSSINASGIKGSVQKRKLKMLLLLFVSILKLEKKITDTDNMPINVIPTKTPEKNFFKVVFSNTNPMSTNVFLSNFTNKNVVRSAAIVPIVP